MASRYAVLVFSLFVLTLAGSIDRAEAGTTGSISGVVRDAVTKLPLPNVTVSAAAPSGSGRATSDARGFYIISGLSPDTYVESFSLAGYGLEQTTGLTVFQDQTISSDATLSKEIRQIARVRSRAGSNLVQPNQTADVYDVSAQQLDAAKGGDNVHKTLYNYLQTVPGVTSAGANGQPRIRGGLATDTGFLYDDILINDRLTGFFSTNNGYFQTTTISSVGVNSVQVYTGGYNARFGNAAQGIVNSVIKRGTYPGSGLVSIATQSPIYGHFVQTEYGTATRDNRYSAYVAFDGSNQDNAFGDERYTFPLATSKGGNGPGPNRTTDVVGNFHYRPSSRDDIQFLIQNGVGLFNGNYMLAGGQPLGFAPCAGYGAANFVVTSPGVSTSGKSCVDTSGALSNANGKSSPANPVATGLQYAAVSPDASLLTYHYSGIGKLQWNHAFSDKLAGYLRFAENFNQYIFNQPLADPNYGNAIRPGDVALGGGNDPYGGGRSFQGDRRSQVYIGSAEVTYTPSARAAYYGGLSLERDNNLQAYYDLGGGLSNPGSAFDINGRYPNLYTVVDFPVTVPTLYAGTTQHLGHLTLEPSLRYDQEKYGVPASIGGGYIARSVSPRFAATYAFSPSLVTRGSYTVTSEFVPATYVYNGSVDGTQGSGQTRNPYAPGAAVAPSMDHNVDFSLEKGFDAKTSLRFSPYYHKSSNRLAVFRNPVVGANGQIVLNPDGSVKFGNESYAKNGGITQDFGVELGFNHVEPQEGLSYFISGTYQNYWSSSTTLAAAAISPVSASKFLLDRSVYRVSGNAPVSLTLTADYHRKNLHVQPFLLYQCCAYYNTTGSGTNAVPDPTVHQAPAYYFANATVAYDMAKSGPRYTTIGLRVQNVFNNLKADITPVPNIYYNNAKLPPGTPPGTVFDGGYYSFAPGQVPNTQYVFPPVPRTPQTFELFLTQHL
ncbi:MAG: hypothetical protein NVSMB19_08680 [Vulcanimicrobiaceae bacterium]